MLSRIGKTNPWGEIESNLTVKSIEDFRALPNRERACRTVAVLKRLRPSIQGMRPRELEDHEIVAGLLLGDGEITR